MPRLGRHTATGTPGVWNTTPAGPAAEANPQYAPPVTCVCPAHPARRLPPDRRSKLVAEVDPAGRASLSPQLLPNHPAPRRPGVRRGFARNARCRRRPLPRRRRSAPGLRRRLCATVRRRLVQSTTADRQRPKLSCSPDRPVRVGGICTRGLPAAAGRADADSVRTWRGPHDWSGRSRLERGSGDGRSGVISAYPIRRYGPNNPGCGAAHPCPRPQSGGPVPGRLYVS